MESAFYQILRKIETTPVTKTEDSEQFEGIIWLKLHKLFYGLSRFLVTLLLNILIST